jgi:hypothetical protein
MGLESGGGLTDPRENTSAEDGSGFGPVQPPDRLEGEVVCWVCGGPVIERHCKIVCQVCGFTRDCSDP